MQNGKNGTSSNLAFQSINRPSVACVWVFVSAYPVSEMKWNFENGGSSSFWISSVRKPAKKRAKSKLSHQLTRSVILLITLSLSLSLTHHAQATIYLHAYIHVHDRQTYECISAYETFVDNQTERPNTTACCSTKHACSHFVLFIWKSTHSSARHATRNRRSSQRHNNLLSTSAVSLVWPTQEPSRHHPFAWHVKAFSSFSNEQTAKPD